MSLSMNNAEVLEYIRRNLLNRFSVLQLQDGIQIYGIIDRPSFLKSNDQFTMYVMDDRANELVVKGFNIQKVKEASLGDFEIHVNKADITEARLANDREMHDYIRVMNENFYKEQVKP
jgi:hypothetical protein